MLLQDRLNQIFTLCKVCFELNFHTLQGITNLYCHFERSAFAQSDRAACKAQAVAKNPHHCCHFERVKRAKNPKNLDTP